MMWLLRNLIIPVMQFTLIIAMYLTVVDWWTNLWVDLAPRTIIGYSTSDASRDLTTFLILFYLWDRFFGPYSVTLRRMAKLIDARHKETHDNR